MALQIFSNNNLDEVVFEQRNKAYGAYAIRKSYPANVNKALLYTLLPLVMLLVVAIFSKKQPPVNAHLAEQLKQLNKSVKEVTVAFEHFEFEAPASLNTVNNAETFTVVPNRQVATNQPVNQTSQIPSATGTATQGADNGAGSSNIVNGNGGVGLSGILVEPTTTIQDFAEVMPAFPGGLDQFYRYLSSEINYPKAALENGVSGKVVVSFVVFENGKVADIKLERGIGFGCDDEALRVISNMPSWVPGSQNGKKVAVKMRIPIKFDVK